jgi:CBS domain-containing protein
VTERELDFDTTMRGLENGLRVEEIATSCMEECSPSDDVDSVLDKMQSNGLEQYPVRDGEYILGILDRYECNGGQHVSDVMIPLRDSMLVASSDSLGTLLPLLGSGRYRLVVRQGRISGIVTQSDLIKLPVRLYAFAKITYLEMLMAELIGTDLPDQSQWMSCLSEGRQEKVSGKIREARDAGLDPSPLEFTDLCDKRQILKKHRGLGKQFECDLKEVERLRDVLAHAGDYGRRLEDLQMFLRRLRLAEEWIITLASVRKGVSI